MNEVKKCPWCNEGRGLIYYKENKMNNVQIICSYCGIAGPWHFTSKEAIDSWNIFVDTIKTGISENKRNFW